jgi:hypothetical protein
MTSDTRRRPRTVACAILLGLVAVTGCSSTERKDEPPGEPPIGALLTVDDLATFELPLDGYQPSSKDAGAEAVTQAEHILIDRCLRPFGLQLPPWQAETGPGSTHVRRYGITDVDLARTRGYRPPATQPERSQPAAAPAVQSVVTGRGQRSYAGRKVPEGGCVGEARRTLANGGEAGVDLDLPNRLTVQLWEQSKQDSRTRRAFDAWSGCVARAGYDYPDPLAALEDPMFTTPEPTAEEIAIAITDVRCKKEAKVVEVWATVETAYQRTAIEDNAESLERVRRQLAVRRANAATVLAGS